MQVPTAKEMQDELSSRLMAMNAAHSSARSSLIILKTLVSNISVSGVSFDGLADTIVDNYFEDLCEQLTKAHAKGSPATIELAYAMYEIEEDIEELIANADAQDVEERSNLILRLLESLSLDRIHTHLSDLVSNLEQKGKSIIADNLVSNLFGVGEIRLKSGRVIVDMDAADYWQRYKTYRIIDRINEGLCSASKETGVNFGPSLFYLKTAVTELTYGDEEIKSRTCFGKGTNLEIMCFRTKYELRFTRSVFDAIAAYVTLHGSDESVEVIREVINSKTILDAA